MCIARSYEYTCNLLKMIAVPKFLITFTICMVTHKTIQFKRR